MLDKSGTSKILKHGDLNHDSECEDDNECKMY